MNIQLETIRAIANGDHQKFEIVFKYFYNDLCRFAFSLLHDAEQAEEEVQEVFVKVWMKRESLTQVENLKAYLFRAVYNQCMNHIKHSKVKQTHAEHVLLSSQNESLQSDELSLKQLKEEIKRHVDQLPDQCRKAFELSRYQELSYKEIAEVMQISVKTVENHIGRALKSLRHALKDFITAFFVVGFTNLFYFQLGVQFYFVVM